MELRNATEDTNATIIAATCRAMVAPSVAPLKCELYKQRVYIYFATIIAATCRAMVAPLK